MIFFCVILTNATVIYVAHLSYNSYMAYIDLQKKRMDVISGCVEKICLALFDYYCRVRLSNSETSLRPA